MTYVLFHLQKELLDINNLGFVLAEDWCKDPPVVISLVLSLLKFNSTEHFALPLDNTDWYVLNNFFVFILSITRWNTVYK